MLSQFLGAVPIVIFFFFNLSILLSQLQIQTTPFLIAHGALSQKAWG